MCPKLFRWHCLPNLFSSKLIDLFVEHFESNFLSAVSGLSLASLAKKHLNIRLEKFPTSAKEAWTIQQLLPALAATQDWTAEKLLRLAPSVQFLKLLTAVGVGDKYIPHQRPIAPEILRGKSECSGCVACTKKVSKSEKSAKPPESKKPKKKELKSAEWLSSTDSDSD